MAETFNRLEPCNGAARGAAINANASAYNIKHAQQHQRDQKQSTAVLPQGTFAEFIPRHATALDHDVANSTVSRGRIIRRIISDRAP